MDFTSHGHFRADATRVIVMAAAALTSGCSLVLDLSDKIPCQLPSDCTYARGVGMCVDGYCQPPLVATTGLIETTGDAESSTSAQGSTTMTSASSSGGETSTSGVALCTQNSDCSSDQRCDDAGACIDLLTNECQTIRWPSGGDRNNVVFVGSIMPTGAPYTHLVQPLENAVSLAVNDFNRETSLAGDRKIAWVGCNDAAGSTASTAAAQHLIDDVGVPAIVGPVFSENVLAVANIAIPAGVFVMTPTATAMSIAELVDDNLVWRTIPGDIYQSNAIVDRLGVLDEGTEPVSRLLVLAKDDAYGNGILETILPQFTSALPMTQVVFRTYPDATQFSTPEEMLAAYGAIYADIVSNNPTPFTHVLLIGTSELQWLYYHYFTAYEISPAMDPVPLFTVSHGAVPELERFINDIGPMTGTSALSMSRPMLEDRLQGTSPIVLNSVNFEAFSIRYRIAFNDEEPLTTAALSYDAALSTLFALSTVGADTAPSGALIAEAMPRLSDPDGTAISFSGSDLSFISDARNALVVDGGTVDLQGVSGELQWNLETGDVRAGVWGWDVLDNSVDGTMPSAEPTRMYCLAPEPATTGTWSDIAPACP